MWNTKMESDLIQLVRTNKCLYDTKHPDYCKRSEKTLILAQIAGILNNKYKSQYSLDEVKKKWNNLRSYKMRLIREKREGHKEKIWYHEEDLDFIRDLSTDGEQFLDDTEKDMSDSYQDGNNSDDQHKVLTDIVTKYGDNFPHIQEDVSNNQYTSGYSDDSSHSQPLDPLLLHRPIKKQRTDHTTDNSSQHFASDRDGGGQSSSANGSRCLGRGICDSIYQHLNDRDISLKHRRTFIQKLHYSMADFLQKVEDD